MASVAPGVPSRLGSVVDRCLVKEPGERFCDGRELAEAIGEGVGAAPDMPVPLRVFVSKIRGFGASFPMLVLLWILVAVLPFVAVLLGEPWPMAELLLLLPAALIIYALVPLTAPWLYARRLRKAGYGVEDARLALKEDVERRLEEVRADIQQLLEGRKEVERLLAKRSIDPASSSP